MEMDAVPAHLVILGGGYIALEFGQMFRRFGSRVTVIEQSGRLLGHEDSDVADEMEKILGRGRPDAPAEHEGDAGRQDGGGRDTDRDDK